MSSSASLPPAVDEEFEAVATQVLKRTQSMVNKYRRLLLVEAEVRPPLAITTLGAHMHSCRHSYTGCLPPLLFSTAALQPVVGNGDDRSDLQPGGAQQPDAGQAHGASGPR